MIRWVLNPEPPWSVACGAGCMSSTAHATHLPPPPPGSVRIRSRTPAGEIVHIFSHIRMTMQVEMMELEVSRVVMAVTSGS